MKRSLAVALGLVAGCAVMGHERVEGWPTLEVVEHHVPHAAMRERCNRYVSFGMSPVACAEFDLVGGRCHVWYSAEFPPPSFVVQHERLHCAGYDHAGSVSMQQMLKRHLASTEAGAGSNSARR